MKVLLIDDDDAIRKVGALALRAVGKFELEVAADAVSGLALARTFEPDVVVMDMMMPGVDGLTAMRQMRDDPALAPLPVIFLTAKVQRSEIEHYLAQGALGVIQKPFDPMQLPGQVREMVERHRRVLAD